MKTTTTFKLYGNIRLLLNQLP